MQAPVFLNSATVRVPEWMVLGGGRLRQVPVAIRYGLLDHPLLGLTLIDTGYGPQVTSDPQRSLFLRTYARVLRIRLQEEEAPAAVLARLGREPEDVQTILLSHFHADHVARLAEFPRARMLVPGQAFHTLSSLSRLAQLHHGYFSELLPEDFRDRITPFEDRSLARHPFWGECRDLAGDGSVLAVDLPGHALGHHGFLFPKLSEPLLYAVDVQWHRLALQEERWPGFPASAVYSDRRAALATSRKVAAFAEGGNRVVLCHHPEAPSEGGAA